MRGLGLQEWHRDADTPYEVLVSLRSGVCLGLLVLAACGGEPGDDVGLAQAADAGAETADARSQAADVDAGVSDQPDGAAEPADARVVFSADAAELVSRPDAAAPCVPGIYVDADGDGFPAATRVSTCAGEAIPQLDCYDANKLAHPGQVGRFATDRGDGSFDYDCDGKETGIYTNVAVCPDVSGWTCAPKPDRDPSDTCDYDVQVAPYEVASEGWAREVPKCGVRDGFGLNLSWDNVTKKFSCFASPDYGPMYENTMLQVCN